MPSELWDELRYPFPNFNSATVEVWGWISNFIPHFIMNVITYPCCKSCFPDRLAPVFRFQLWKSEICFCQILFLFSVQIHVYHHVQYFPRYKLFYSLQKNLFMVIVCQNCKRAKWRMRVFLYTAWKLINFCAENNHILVKVEILCFLWDQHHPVNGTKKMYETDNWKFLKMINFLAMCGCLLQFYMRVQSVLYDDMAVRWCVLFEVFDCCNFLV